MTGRRGIVRQSAASLLLIIAGCRSVPIRAGPLPAAHSCYRMSGSLLPYAVAQSDTVWLLLSDQSQRRFGARTFEALILDGRTRIPAVWHSVGRDSLRIEWEGAAGVRTVEFRETPDGIAGHAATNDGAMAGNTAITGRRADCALLANR